MDELIEKAAAARGLPAAMVERSAAARAKAEGKSVEAVLREWAGEEPGDDTAAEPAAETVPAEATPSTEEGDSGAEPADEPASGPKVEVIGPETDEPAAEGGEADVEEPEPEPEAPVGPKGVPALSGFPGWLAAVFLVVPAIAVLYAVLAPDGPECGVAGQLEVDPVTGEAVNCDGTPWGEDAVDNFALGEELYVGRCASCHGANGGGGVGPGFTGGAVLATFPAGSCATEDGHIAWVTLGSTGWPDPTYGATSKPVGGVGTMPPFGEALTEQELAAVVLYERVAFGGEALADAEADCGLTGEVTATP
jgi:mono/diheme cytochrome c family protein